MNRKWKPGDVAATPHGELAVFTESGWRWAKTGLICLNQAGVADYAHPVAVIDYENGDHVERFLMGLRGVDVLETSSDEAVQFDLTTTALREYATGTTPTKPDEPTTLGAVVKDRDGWEWVRARPVGNDGGLPPWYAPKIHCWRHWSQVDLVEVVRP